MIEPQQLLRQQERFGEAGGKLDELKQHDVQAIGMDYDGTIRGGAVTPEQTTELLLDIAHTGVIPVVISARDATLRREQFGRLREATEADTAIQTPIYLATANGSALYRIQQGEVSVAYSNNLADAEAEKIIHAYEQLPVSISDERDARRQADLKQDWRGLIEDNKFALSRQHRGVWAENGKVSLLLPEDGDIGAYASTLQQALGDEYMVSWGGQPMLDVTRQLPYDGKQYAMERVLDEHHISVQNAATFGDTPNGNDRALTQAFPYGFTNDTTYMSPISGNPPHALQLSGLDPVQTVHSAIRYLISEPQDYSETDLRGNLSKLISLRSRLLSASTRDEVMEVCTEFDIYIGEPLPHTVSEREKKGILARYYADHLPMSQDRETHAQKLTAAVNRAVSHLQQTDAHVSLLSFGSFGRGKITGPHSDLDFAMVAGHCQTEAEVDREIEKLRALEKRGYLFSTDLGSFDDIREVFRTGNKLARLYAITTDGLEVEFHIIGENELQKIAAASSEPTRRVQRTADKLEDRTSFRGRQASLPKAGDSVWHYLTTEVDGSTETFIGFFANVFIEGVWLYDRLHVSNEFSQAHWNTYVTAFLRHNNAFRTDGTQRFIDPSAASFDRFLSTFRYGSQEHYSSERLAQLTSTYYQTLNRIARSL